MIRKVSRVFVLAMVVIAAGNIGMPEVRAEAITGIDGVNFSFQLSSPGGTNQTATISYGNSFVTQLNHNSAVLPITIGNMLLNTTPHSVAGGTEYFFQPGTIAQTINGTVGTASFSLTGLTAFVPNVNTASLVLSGSTLLKSNSTNPDFSPFFNGGTFTFTLNVGDADFNNMIQNGNNPGEQSTGSGSFSEQAVPEPGSLVLFGLGSLGMAGYAYRRKRVALI